MFGRITQVSSKVAFGLMALSLVLTPESFAQAKFPVSSTTTPIVKSTAPASTGSNVKTTTTSTTSTPTVKTSVPTSAISLQPLGSVQGLNTSGLQNVVNKPAQSTVTPTVINGQLVNVPPKADSVSTSGTTIVNGQVFNIGKSDASTFSGVPTDSGNGVLISFQSNIFLSADANPTEPSFGSNLLPNALQCTGVSPFDLHIYSVPAGQKTAALGAPPRFSIALSGCRLDSSQLGRSVVAHDYTEAMSHCAIMDGGCDFIWADKGPDNTFGENDTFTIAKFE